MPATVVRKAWARGGQGGNPQKGRQEFGERVLLAPADEVAHEARSNIRL